MLKRFFEIMFQPGEYVDTSDRYAKEFLSQLKTNEIVCAEAVARWGIGFEIILWQIGNVRTRIFMERVAPAIRRHPKIVSDILAERALVEEV